MKELAFERIKIRPFTSIKKRRSFLSAPEIGHSIIKFYNRDDISRQSPRARDKVKISNEKGEEIVLQKRHLVMSVREAHSIRKTENPNLTAGKSKFASLRPKNVLLTMKILSS